MNENQINPNNIFEEKKKRKRYGIFILLFLVLLGIGYSYLQTLLNITGTTTVDKNTWDVYWDDLYVLNGSVATEETGEVAATINQNDKTEVSFTVNLKKPGDYYEFIVDARNDGSIDAMIESYSLKVDGQDTIPSYIDYTVMYDDYSALARKQILRSGEFGTYKVRVEYNTNINSTDLPENDVVLSCEFGITYVQADSSAIEIQESAGIYQVHEPQNSYDRLFSLGKPVPSGVTTYNSYTDLMNDTGHSIFVKHVVINNIIKTSQIGFVYQNKVYYLRGGGSIINTETGKLDQYSIYYDKNKRLVTNLFGSDHCEENIDGDFYSFECSTDEVGVWITNVGMVGAESNQFGCGVMYEHNSDFTLCSVDDSGD